MRKRTLWLSPVKTKPRCIGAGGLTEPLETTGSIPQQALEATGCLPKRCSWSWQPLRIAQRKRSLGCFRKAGPFGNSEFLCSRCSSWKKVSSTKTMAYENRMRIKTEVVIGDLNNLPKRKGRKRLQLNCRAFTCLQNLRIDVVCNARYKPVCWTDRKMHEPGKLCEHKSERSLNGLELDDFELNPKPQTFFWLGRSVPTSKPKKFLWIKDEGRLLTGRCTCLRRPRTGLTRLIPSIWKEMRVGR